MLAHVERVSVSRMRDFFDYERNYPWVGPSSVACVTCHMLCSHVTCHVSHVMCRMSCVTCHVSHFMCHISCVTFHVSHFMCHISCVTFHLSQVTCNFFSFLFFGQSGEAYLWRVCYQRGLPIQWKLYIFVSREKEKNIYIYSYKGKKDCNLLYQI